MDKQFNQCALGVSELHAEEMVEASVPSKGWFDALQRRKDDWHAKMTETFF